MNRSNPVLFQFALRLILGLHTSAATESDHGLSTDGKVFRHGGAYATNMEIDSQRGLITIWMVQHAGYPGQGGQALGAFKHAALEKFGTATR